MRKEGGRLVLHPGCASMDDIDEYVGLVSDARRMGARKLVRGGWVPKEEVVDVGIVKRTDLACLSGYHRSIQVDASCCSEGESREKVGVVACPARK
jgi:hypothetical protein